MMVLTALLPFPAAWFLSYHMNRKTRGVRGMLVIFSSSRSCIADTICSWVPRDTNDNNSSLGHLQKDRFPCFGLWNNCRHRSCICLGGTSLLSFSNPRKLRLTFPDHQRARLWGQAIKKESASTKTAANCGKSVDLKQSSDEGLSSASSLVS